MNEEYEKAYKDLIIAMLEANTNEQALEFLGKALENNPDLLSTELVSQMQRVSDRLRGGELEEEADWLQYISEKITEIIGNPNILSDQYVTEEYFDFLRQLIDSNSDINQSQQRACILLSKEPDRINSSLVTMLEQVMVSVLPYLSHEDSQEIASNIFKLSNQLSELQPHIIQDSIDVIEVSINGFKIALNIFSPARISSEWAEAQFKLGITYEKRIYGTRKQNLESAIEAYEKALQVYERTTSPEKWALIQIYLGGVYHRRLYGNNADNLEKSFEFYQAALEIFTQESHPEEWAIIQANLGSLYPDRIYGDFLERTELAISCCKKALLVFDQTNFPDYWAKTQCILGEVYRERIIEDVDNYQLSIDAFESALKVYTYDEYPYNWADCKIALGLVYYDLERYDDSIQAYQSALQVYSYENSPEKWASIQDGLGGVYFSVAPSYGEKNIEYLEKAISAYKAALQVRTTENYPSEWALTLTHLAGAYAQLDQLDKSFTCYRSALEFYRANSFYYEFLAIGLSYGSTARHHQRWAESIEGFEILLEALELERTWSRIDVRRKQLASDFSGLYEIMIDTYLKINQPDKALELVERSKARYLVDLISNKTYPKKELFSEEAYEKICSELDRLRGDIRQEQVRLELEEREKSNEIMSKNGTLPPILPKNRNYLNELYEKLDKLVHERIKPLDKNFLLTQKVTSISLEEIQGLLSDRQTVIIEWCILNDKILTFIIHQTELNVLETQSQDLQALNKWLDAYLEGYSDRRTWRNRLEFSLCQLSEILKLRDILKLLPEDCQQLILIPHRLLHLLPLHALPLPEQNDKCLLNIFSEGVRYAPSCQLLQLAQRQEDQPLNHFFGIQNPTQNLTYASLQVQTIRQQFHIAEVLQESEATKAALTENNHYINQLNSTHCLHFACHGNFDEQSPLESHLKLANDEFLTLGEIFNFELGQCQLVVLSACETGLTDHTSASDEYIGLPSGFLFAGSPSVVSSLWKVDELATAFLMIKFYANLPKHTKIRAGDVAVALNKAQIWLRDLSHDKFKQCLNEYMPQIDEIITKLPKSWMREVAQNSLQHALNRQPCPFASPYYWAGFIATGR